MCGIAGFTGKKNSAMLKALSIDLSHRGPDGEGFYESENLSLLNRRLAIIDRKGGDQPIYNEDKSIVTVFNGEIYNYKEIRNELKSFEHIFKTDCDTEVIVHGYEQWGYDFFDKLNGMFAIALYDTKKNKLILARDQFGIKPLYYSKVGNNLIFSSEIKPILNNSLNISEVNQRILYRYLKFRIHDDGRETFFLGINRILPGEMMVVSMGKQEFIKYSNIEKDILKHVDNYVENNSDPALFYEKFKDAVCRRLISEVPVGTALSGGLDSSSVVAVVNKLLESNNIDAKSVGKTQNTFSAVFPGSSNDEEKYIDDLLDKTKNITSHKVIPKSQEFFNDIRDFVHTQEEPTISTGPYAQYQVMRIAKDYVTVLLDGQGADEMMAGYLPYYFVYLRQLQNEKKLLKLLKECWSSREVLIKYLQILIADKLNTNELSQIGALLKDDFVTKFKNEQFSVENKNLKKRLRDDIFKNSLQSLLRYEDRNTMRFSLEGRVPFLDVNLLKYIFSLPVDVIIKNGWNKNILRESMKSRLPKSITWRRNKIGFTTPEYDWFMNSKKEIYEILLSDSFANRPYWDSQKVLKSYRLFLQGKHSDTMLFWRLMNTELWLREFIDVDKVEPERSKVCGQKFILGNPNPDKKIEIQVDKKTYSRFPVKTKLFKKGDDYAEKIADNIFKITNDKLRIANSKWYVIVSEKIVAISQGRSYFLWDIEPTWWANTLSNFVERTPYGIGLGSAWTMQLAIDEAGLPRILLASLIAALTKPFGIRGMFYRIAGSSAASIDGPTEYSLYPSNVSAKLAPKDPQKAAEKIEKEIGLKLKNEELRIENSEYFGGVVIIDANDIGRNILGNATDKPDSFFKQLMRDNPMGQGSEGTPVVIVV